VFSVRDRKHLVSAKIQYSKRRLVLSDGLDDGPVYAELLFLIDRKSPLHEKQDLRPEQTDPFGPARLQQIEFTPEVQVRPKADPMSVDRLGGKTDNLLLLSNETFVASLQAVV
jgi:hypothetical protein